MVIKHTTTPNERGVVEKFKFPDELPVVLLTLVVLVIADPFLVQKEAFAGQVITSYNRS